jgi:hypothetical protein
MSMMLRALTIVALAVASLRVPNLDGTLVDPFQAPAGTRATVFLFVSTDCPISNRYAPDIHRLEDEFAKNGVAFSLVYPNPAEEAAAIREHVSAFSLPWRALRDPGHGLVKYAGVTITPEAAIYDASGRLTYRGRIDDRYSAIGAERTVATRRDLRDAIAATLAGKPVAQRFTQAVGCFVADFVR